MDDLLETFVSSNFTNFKQTTTITTIIKTTGTGDKPAQATITTKTVGNIEIKDLTEVFGSFDINKYRIPVTTTKKKK